MTSTAGRRLSAVPGGRPRNMALPAQLTDCKPRERDRVRGYLRSKNDERATALLEQLETTWREKDGA